HLTPMMFDFALAIWTLQHVLELRVECERIFEFLKPGGRLFLVNNKNRVLPTNDGRWIDDQLDIRKVLDEVGFAELALGELEGEDIAPGHLRTNTFWAVYEKR